MTRNTFFTLFFVFFGKFILAQSDTAITLRAITGLQYDLPRFAVKPKQKITLLLKNDDDMAHNVVFVKPNKRLEIVEAALKLEGKGAELNYVPASTNVLIASKVLIPNSTETLTFTAPAQEGIYPYVCTYPGHGYVMYGAMYVTTKPLPPLGKDPNIPPSRQAEASTSAHHHEAPSPHPFALEYPLLYRTFMPDCGPAAIAVALSPTESYCFDAGKCMLRYAWTGGFVDNTDHWKGNGNALAKIQGTIYFKEQITFPLRVGSIEKTPQVQFKGYKLAKRLPTFLYKLDQMLVRETLQLDKNQNLVRVFEFEKPTASSVYFVTVPNKGVLYRHSAGKWEKDVLVLPKGTNKFSVTIERQAVTTR
jgi:azurin